MIENLANAIFHFFRSVGAGGSFLSMFIENIGIPLPTELGYLLGQELINTHKHSFLFIITILTLGHVSGAIVAYKIGTLGDSFVTKKLHKNKKIVEVNLKVKGWYKKYGTITVFLTRFVGYVRPWSSFVAGFAAVPFWTFVLWTALGSLLFNIMALYLSSIFILVWRRFETLHIAITIGMFLLFFGLIIFQAVKLLIGSRKEGKRG